MWTGEFRDLVIGLNKGEPVKVLVNQKQLEELETLYQSEYNHFSLALYAMEILKNLEFDFGISDEDFERYYNDGEVLFSFDPKSWETSLYWWLDDYYFIDKSPFYVYKWNETSVDETNFWMRIIENYY